MAEYTERNAKWLEWLTPEKFNDAELFRIVTFFVFHSPCPQLSSMGRTLNEYGWKTPWKKPYSLNKQLRQAATNYNLIYSANTYDNMSEALSKAALKDGFPTDLDTERICIYDNLKNQFTSVFYHIRNAFAHCRLNMVDHGGECIFILEDVQPNKTSDNLKVSARMILRKSTLLKWIKIIESGETYYCMK